MKKNSLIFILVLLITRASFSQIQPGNEGFCSQLTMVSENINDPEIVRGEFKETVIDFLGSYNIFEAKINLDGFNKGEYIKEPMFGPSCVYTYSEILSDGDENKAFNKLVDAISSCLGAIYSLADESNNSVSFHHADYEFQPGTFSQFTLSKVFEEEDDSYLLQLTIYR